MGDERRPQFMHWRAKISCTEDFYLEGSLEMCNTDHKGPEESGKSLPEIVTSFSCSCLSAESTPHNFSLSSSPLKNTKMKKFSWLRMLWRAALWAASTEPFLAGLCPGILGSTASAAVTSHQLQALTPFLSLSLCSPSGRDVNLSQLSGIANELHHIYLTRVF